MDLKDEILFRTREGGLSAERLELDRSVFASLPEQTQFTVVVLASPRRLKMWLLLNVVLVVVPACAN